MLRFVDNSGPIAKADATTVIQPIIQGVATLPQVVPNAIDWPNASAFSETTTTFQQFTGIDSLISVSCTHSIAAPLVVTVYVCPTASIVGVPYITLPAGTTTFTVPPNYYVLFDAQDPTFVTGCPPNTFTIRNVSNSSAIIDTFTIEVLVEV